jgi:Transposase DDE domain
MPEQYLLNADGKQASLPVSHQLGRDLTEYLRPLLAELDQRLDKRLVKTLLALVMVIIKFRHSSQGLLLSELGGYLLSPAQSPAGTKRISNLLRSRRWHYGLIERFLWGQGDAAVAALEAEGQEALCLWDESVLEKAESIALEGLCAVRSSVARRLKRIKPGYFNPPGGRPIFVPGMNWVLVMVSGLQTRPTVAAMRWWTSRGPLRSDQRSQEKTLLQVCVRRWGRRVIHVWDRGFAGTPWLGTALAYQTRFVMRWPKKNHLLGPQGKTNAWKICRGKRSWEHRQIWDARRRCRRKTGIFAIPVAHPAFPHQPLWLVVSRPGKGRSPWYLLTSEPIHTPADAWRIVFIYARRWQIEMAFRFTKTELAFESPRLWSWQNRLKLLFVATLAYAFLLSLVQLPAHVQQWLLRFWCHRTGKRYREAYVPLYRLRSALSRLWLAYPPPLISLWENPG